MNTAGRALATLASSLLAGVLLVGVRTSPLSWEIASVAASCGPPPPVFAPTAAEVVARNASVRIERNGRNKAPKLSHDGAEVPFTIEHLVGSDRLVPRKELAPGAYALELELEDWGNVTRVPFVVSEEYDLAAPTWGRLAVTAVEHGSNGCGGRLATYHAVLDVRDVHDDRTSASSIAWRVWTAVPPSVPDLGAAPVATLLAPAGFLLLGDGKCQVADVPLPLEGSVTVALQPIDLAGHAGVPLQTTFELRAMAAVVAHPSAPPHGSSATGTSRSLLWLISSRLVLGLVAAALTLRILARRA